MSDPYTLKFHCAKSDGTCGPAAPVVYSNIRKAYCPTNYFNGTNPDQYTYLQYWRRRMCYSTYLNYNNPTKPRM